MRNQVFQAQTETEKRKKLEIVLHQLVGNQLTDRQRWLIAQAIDCRRQYSFQLCRELDFPAGTVGQGDGQTVRHLIFHDTGGPTAVLVQCPAQGEQSNTVYIYLPAEKGE